LCFKLTATWYAGYMMAKMKFLAPLLMAGAAATAIYATPLAVAETFAAATGNQITHVVPLDQPGSGSGCSANGTCGGGGPNGGAGCTADGTCGGGGPQGGSGCTAAGACGHGGPLGSEGCAPGVGCFNWGE
jgi:hypothetical protein